MNRGGHGHGQPKLPQKEGTRLLPCYRSNPNLDGNLGFCGRLLFQIDDKKNATKIIKIFLIFLKNSTFTQILSVLGTRFGHVSSFETRFINVK